MLSARASLLPAFFVVAITAFLAGELSAAIRYADVESNLLAPPAASRRGASPASSLDVRQTRVGTDTLLVDIAAADLAGLAGTPSLFEALGVRPSDSIVAIDGRSIARAGTDAVTQLTALPGSFRELDLRRDGAPLRLLVVAH
jgi:hypothetical protein